jgi:hypothetical protein
MVSADDKEPIEAVKPSFVLPVLAAPRRAVEKQVEQERQ